jgi:daunorubicin resistance ABC transporter ATP-binding subunit
MSYAIEVHALEKTFKGGVRALDGVSFAVEPASVFGLLGPNGAGKTTVIRVLTTILRPDAGAASVLGRDVVQRAGEVRQLIGLAGQYAAVDENLTGRENLTMVGRLNHLSGPQVASRASALLKQFDLSDAGDRTLKTYSGGMRRRLDLAAALMSRPPVLFLDEPTTGLDPQSRNSLWEVIEGLVDEGTTVLLTTQYLEEADRLAGRIAVVDRGKVIAEGTPAALKGRLGSTLLEVSFPNPGAAAEAATLLSGVGAGTPRVTGTSVELPVDSGPSTAIEVLRTLDRAAVTPSGLLLHEPTLDDVFLTLTGHRTEDDDGRSVTDGDGAPSGRHSAPGAPLPPTARPDPHGTYVAGDGHVGEEPTNLRAASEEE